MLEVMQTIAAGQRELVDAQREMCLCASSLLVEVGGAPRRLLKAPSGSCGTPAASRSPSPLAPRLLLEPNPRMAGAGAGAVAVPTTVPPWDAAVAAAAEQQLQRAYRFQCNAANLLRAAAAALTSLAAQWDAHEVMRQLQSPGAELGRRPADVGIRAMAVWAWVALRRARTRHEGEIAELSALAAAVEERAARLVGVAAHRMDAALCLLRRGATRELAGRMLLRWAAATYARQRGSQRRAVDGLRSATCALFAGRRDKIRAVWWRWRARAAIRAGHSTQQREAAMRHAQHSAALEAAHEQTTALEIELAAARRALRDATEAQEAATAEAHAVRRALHIVEDQILAQAVEHRAALQRVAAAACDGTVASTAAQVQAAFEAAVLRERQRADDAEGRLAGAAASQLEAQYDRARVQLLHTALELAVTKGTEFADAVWAVQRSNDSSSPTRTLPEEHHGPAQTAVIVGRQRATQTQLLTSASVATAATHDTILSRDARAARRSSVAQAFGSTEMVHQRLQAQRMLVAWRWWASCRVASRRVASLRAENRELRAAHVESNDDRLNALDSHFHEMHQRLQHVQEENRALRSRFGSTSTLAANDVDSPASRHNPLQQPHLASARGSPSGSALSVSLLHHHHASGRAASAVSPGSPAPSLSPLRPSPALELFAFPSHLEIAAAENSGAAAQQALTLHSAENEGAAAGGARLVGHFAVTGATDDDTSRSSTASAPFSSSHLASSSCKDDDGETEASECHAPLPQNSGTADCAQTAAAAAAMAKSRGALQLAAAVHAAAATASARWAWRTWRVAATCRAAAARAAEAQTAAVALRLGRQHDVELRRLYAAAEAEREASAGQVARLGALLVEAVAGRAWWTWRACVLSRRAGAEATRLGTLLVTAVARGAFHQWRGCVAGRAAARALALREREVGQLQADLRALLCAVTDVLREERSPSRGPATVTAGPALATLTPLRESGHRGTPSEAPGESAEPPALIGEVGAGVVGSMMSFSRRVTQLRRSADAGAGAATVLREDIDHLMTLADDLYAQLRADDAAQGGEDGEGGAGAGDVGAGGDTGSAAFHATARGSTASPALSNLHDSLRGISPMTLESPPTTAIAPPPPRSPTTPRSTSV